MYSQHPSYLYNHICSHHAHSQTAYSNYQTPSQAPAYGECFRNRQTSSLRSKGFEIIEYRLFASCLDSFSDKKTFECVMQV